MKNTFILSLVMSVLFAGTISAGLACENCNKELPKLPCKCQKHFDKHHHKLTKEEFKKIKKDREARKKEFENQLQLTQQQKEQINQNRAKSRQEMEPVMREMKANFDKIQKIKNSDLSDAEKTKQIEDIKKEILPLKQKAETIRKQNVKDFENILTDEQKIKLENLKKEKMKKIQTPKN